MFKALWHFLRRFFFDEEQFLKMSGKAAAQIRAVLGGIGIAGVSFTDDIVTYLPNPAWAPKVRFAGAICVFLAFLLRAGDKTPPEVKDAAKVITSGGYKVSQ